MYEVEFDRCYEALIVTSLEVEEVIARSWSSSLSQLRSTPIVGMMMTISPV
jgi:hypothetical protein